MKKRIIATVLCILMLMTVVPVAAQDTEQQGAAKKDIMLSSIDLENRTAEFLGLLPEDVGKVSLDFDKINLELKEDMTTDQVEDVLVQQGCVKIRGVVTENAYTDIYGYKEIDTEDDEAVVIDITEASEDLNVDTFLVGDSDAGSFIGKAVVAYVREIDNEWEIILIQEDSESNDCVTIGFNQFERISDDSRFEYYKTETAYHATSVTLDEDVTVVYNNVGGYQVDDIFGDIVEEGGCTFFGGQITLIDNDGVYGYNVIFVELAEAAVVDFAEEGYVAFKNGTALTEIFELEYDSSETERMVKVIKNGEDIALSELEEWDVLSVYAASGDASYIVVEVIDSSVVGVITGESASLTSATGKRYKINDVYYDAAAGAYGVGGIGVGDGGEFYVDKYGKIAAFREDMELATGIKINYAYVTAVAFDEDIFAGKYTAIIQLVTEDGLVNFNLKETGAKLNGTSVNADDNRTELQELVNQMITYTTNSSGVITSIVTMDYDNAFDGGMYEPMIEAEYDSDDNRFIGKFWMDPDSFVFFIDPYDTDESYLGTEKDLVDGEIYEVMGKYADRKAMDYNIVIISTDVEKTQPSEPDSEMNYAYVTAATVEEEFLTGMQTAILQLVTADGVEVLYVKKTGAILNDEEFDADDYTYYTINDVFAGQIIKYTVNDSDEITKIIMADYDESLTGGAYGRDVEFDAANNSFVNGFDVAQNATVFFIDERDAEDSYVGTTEDLIDGVNYEVWGRYATEDAEVYNILIVKRIAGVVSPKAGFAVIENVGNSENMDGERILSIKYFSKNETIIADTTWEVYDEAERYLTPGDIVKLNINKNGIIDALEIVYDFEEGVRANYADSPDGYELTFDEVYNASGAEVIAGGVVENYRKASAVATIDGQDFKLSQADNIYVIDANGRKLSIANGSTSSFKYFEDLYDEEVRAVDIAIDGETFENVDIEEAKLITDNIFARAYDGRVTDVVIVKGPEDVRIRGAYYNSLSTLSFNQNASTLASSDAVVVKVTNLTLEGEMVDDYNLATNEIYTVVNRESLAFLNVTGQNVTITGAESGTYMKGATVTLNAIANSGYRFKGWYAEGRCVCEDETYELVLESDVELTAKAERRLYEIDVELTEDEYQWYFDVSAADVSGEANVYVAIYDAVGRMITVVSEALVADDVTTISVAKNSGAAYAKVHIVDENVEFRAISKRVDFN